MKTTTPLHHLHRDLAQAWIRDFSPGHDILTAAEILDRVRGDLDRYPLMAQALTQIRDRQPSRRNGRLSSCGLSGALMRLAESATGEPIRLQAVGVPGRGRAYRWRLVRGAGPAVVRRA